MKICTKCKQAKPLSEFYKCACFKDGHQYICKECDWIYRQENKNRKQVNNKTYYLQNQERIKNRVKSYRKTSQGKSTHENGNKRYFEKYPERKIAIYLLNKAVVTKKIKKPKKCSICKRKTHIQGHHDDYNKPYEVIWACPQCHTNLHQKRKQKYAG